MARMRFALVAAIVLALGSCQLLEQQENFIAFTLDGMQYLYTVSDDSSGHPYAVGYQNSGEVVRYRISGSATAAEAEAGENTIGITLTHTRNLWDVQLLFDDGNGMTYFFSVPDVDEDAISSFIANRDEVGGQLAGAMPGPFSDGQMTRTLENIIFSVERLPNEESN